MAVRYQGGRSVPLDPAKPMKRAEFILQSKQTIADLSNMRTTLSLSDAFSPQLFDELRRAETMVRDVLMKVERAR